MLLKTSNQVKNTVSFSDYFNHRLREGILIATAAVSLFILLALFTHSTADPIWTQVKHANVVINLGGRAGAFFSDFLFYLFGYLAYLLPLLLFYGAWLYFRYSNLSEEDYLANFILLRATGFVFIFVAGCGLASLHWLLDPPRLSGGGLIGMWVAIKTVDFFNTLGANLILAGFFLTGLTLFTGLSWVKIADYLGEQVWCFATAFRAFVLRLDIWVMTSSDKEEMIELGEEERASKSIAPIVRVEPKINWENFKNTEIEADYDEPFIATGSKSTVVKRAPIISKNNPPEILFEPPLAGTLPPLSLLDMATKSLRVKGYSNQELESISKEVEIKLQDFGICQSSCGASRACSHTI